MIDNVINDERNFAWMFFNDVFNDVFNFLIQYLREDSKDLFLYKSILIQFDPWSVLYPNSKKGISGI